MCKTETTKGLHVKDYHDLDYKALEEIKCLDEQLEEQLKTILGYLVIKDSENAIHAIKCLMNDTRSHRFWTEACAWDNTEKEYEVFIENCMSRHNDATSSIECLECNCPDCAYSRG